MTSDEIAAIVTGFGGLAQVVRAAEPADKAEIYAQMGLTLRYQPESRLVEATVKPEQAMCKGFVSEARSDQLPHTRT
jgi:site-specific DNA recombinase